MRFEESGKNCVHYFLEKARRVELRGGEGSGAQGDEGEYDASLGGGDVTSGYSRDKSELSRDGRSDRLGDGGVERVQPKPAGREAFFFSLKSGKTLATPPVNAAAIAYRRRRIHARGNRRRPRTTRRATHLSGDPAVII